MEPATSGFLCWLLLTNGCYIVGDSYWAQICWAPMSMLICLPMLVVSYFSLSSDYRGFSFTSIHLLRLPLAFLLSPENEEPLILSEFLYYRYKMMSS